MCIAYGTAKEITCIQLNAIELKFEFEPELESLNVFQMTLLELDSQTISVLERALLLLFSIIPLFFLYFCIIFLVFCIFRRVIFAVAVFGPFFPFLILQNVFACNERIIHNLI